EIEFADDLQGEKIAAENAEFGLQFRGIVIFQTQRGGVLEVHAGVWFVDFNRAVRLIDLWHLQAGDGYYGENSPQASDDVPLPLQQNPVVFADGGFVGES